MNDIKPSYYVNSVISLTVMIFFRFIPAPDPITPYGMALLGIFIGAVYGWCTVSMIWPTLIALTLLGLTGDNTVNGIWGIAWGNPNILFIFFLMIFAALLSECGLDRYITSWALSRKFTEGHPFLLSFVLMFAAAVCGMVIGPAATIIIFWTLIDSLSKELGYSRGDKFPAALVLGTTWSSCLGSLAMPFQTTAVLNFSLFFTGTNGELTSYNFASYLVFGVIMSIISMLVLVAYFKFVIRPDVSLVMEYKAKTFDDGLKMDGRQRMAMIIFIALVILLLVPSFFAGSTNSILAFINKLGTLGSAAIMLAILTFVVYNKKPFISVVTLIKKGVIWELIFMLCGGLTIGGILAGPDTGITPFMANFISPILSSVGTIGYLLIFMSITLVLTNCANNVPVAAVLLPLQYSVCQQLDMNPFAVVACFIFVVDYAFFLPSSSPVGALLHNSDGRISKSYIYKWAGPLLIIQMLIMVFIGYPFGDLVF